MDIKTINPEHQHQHQHVFRVYYEDTDAGGIVYHANYLKYMERTRTEWLLQKQAGFSQLLKEKNLIFVLYKVNLTYLKPAKLHHELLVSFSIEKETPARLVCQQNVSLLHEGDLLCQGEIVLTVVHEKSLKISPFPNRFMPQ